MCGVVAATEVVYYASKMLDGNAMHYKHRQQAPMGCGDIHPSGRVLLLWLLETDKGPRVTREGETRRFGWFSAFGWLREVLPSLRAKQLVKSASTFCPLSACFLGRKKCFYRGSTATAASRQTSQEIGLPTRKTRPRRAYLASTRQHQENRKPSRPTRGTSAMHRSCPASAHAAW